MKTQPHRHLGQQRSAEILSSKTPKPSRERGASLVEYSILVSLISIISIVAVRQLGNAVQSQFNNSSKVLSGSAGVEDEVR